MLSVIIPTRSRKQNLVNTLTALTSQSLGTDKYEIIISDDNSTDNTFEVYEQFKSKCRLKYVNNNTKPHSWNASVPRNLGAAVADMSSQAFVFVDSDVILPTTALEHFWEDFEYNKNRIIIGPYDFYAQGNETIAQADVRSGKFNSVDRNETFNTVFDGLAMFGGNLLFPKRLFWEVGGFDTDVHIGLEDGSMGLKCWKKQIPMSYDKRLWGRHQWHETPKDRFPSNMKEHINYLNEKHFGTKEPDYGIVEASRETYAHWGFPNWTEPEEWKQNQIQFGLKVNND